MSKIWLVVGEIFQNIYFQVVLQLFCLPWVIIFISNFGLVPKAKFKIKSKAWIWAISDQGLLTYSTINSLRLSSNVGCLPWVAIFIYYMCKICCGHISLSLKFGQDLNSGCGDIPQWIFWGRLSIKVFFHGWSSSFYISIKFGVAI